jgi:heat shock protein HslJ
VVAWIVALLIVTAGAAALAGCALVPSPWVGRWELVTVGGNPPAAQGSIVFTNTDVVIETGCNEGAGRYRLDGSRLTLDGVAFTAALCTGALGTQDAAFLALASGSPSLGLDGDRMTIDAGGGTPVLLLARTSGA